MTDDPVEEMQSSPVALGENPTDLEFGCGVAGDRVVIKFNTLVQWFDLEPSLAVDFAEAIISSAEEARDNARIIAPRMPPGSVLQ